MDAQRLFSEALQQSGFDAATVQAASVGCGYCPRCLLSGLTTPIEVRRRTAGRVSFRCGHCGFTLEMPAAGRRG